VALLPCRIALLWASFEFKIHLSLIKRKAETGTLLLVVVVVGKESGGKRGKDKLLGSDTLPPPLSQRVTR